MDIKICPKCDAKWIQGNHFWSTGAKGNEADLAGLVCNQYGDYSCINPLKGDETGDTWEKRFDFIGKLSDKDPLNPLN